MKQPKFGNVLPEEAVEKMGLEAMDIFNPQKRYKLITADMPRSLEEYDEGCNYPGAWILVRRRTAKKVMQGKEQEFPAYVWVTQKNSAAIGAYVRAVEGHIRPLSFECKYGFATITRLQLEEIVAYTKQESEF